MTFHNIVAHPLMEILKLMSFEKIGKILHDKTVPDNVMLHTEDPEEDKTESINRRNTKNVEENSNSRGT